MDINAFYQMMENRKMIAKMMREAEQQTKQSDIESKSSEPKLIREKDFFPDEINLGESYGN